jgi:dienelactone hydrolase
MRLAGVPVLIASPPPHAVASDDQHRPAVLWMHGFRADALAHVAELKRCAALGFVAVGIDAVDHGARSNAALVKRLEQSTAGALPVMLDIVDATVRELPAVIDALVHEHGVDRRRVSLVGISMGAFLAYRAIADGIPLRSSVALLGSPEWPGPSSAHQRLDAFRGTALLSVTAEHDTNVPPAPVNRLHGALHVLFGDAAVRHHHHHHELRGSGHLTNAAQWGEAMQLTMAWLARHGR